VQRRLFVAGSTGVIGRAVVRLARAARVPVVPHARPRRDGAAPADPKAAVFDLGDTKALTDELSRCTTVLQLIGTMRTRFGAGDTYETSDILTTQQLADASRAAGIRHLVLLSSAGASRRGGPYLAAKARAEEVVVASGVPYTIVRPGFFEGEGRHGPPLVGAFARAIGAWSFRPIPVERVAAALLHIAREGRPLGTVVEGRALWDLSA
jgi:uncharacterized protein YbjT (DUF2867 family)